MAIDRVRTQTVLIDWIPELIAAAGPEVAETYIDFFTSTICNRNTRAAYARGLLAVFLTGARLMASSSRPCYRSRWPLGLSTFLDPNRPLNNAAAGHPTCMIPLSDV